MDQGNQKTSARKAAGASRDIPANRPPGVGRTTARKTGRAGEPQIQVGPHIRPDPVRPAAGQPLGLAQRGSGVATKSVEGRRPIQQAYARADGAGPATHISLRKRTAPVRHDRGQQLPPFGAYQSLASTPRAAKTVLLPPWVNDDDTSPGNRRHRSIHDIGGRTSAMSAHNLLGHRQRVNPEDVTDGRWVIGPDMSIQRAGMLDQADNHERYSARVLRTPRW